MEPLTWGAIGLLLTAIGTLLGKWWDSAKTRAEALRLRQELNAVKAGVNKAAFELSNNHGSSTKDAVDRTESAILDLTKELRFSTGALRNDIQQLGRDLGVEREQRLQHEKDSASKHQAHDAWKTRIESALTPSTGLWHPQSGDSG